jgi:hypothetical protein
LAKDTVKSNAKVSKATKKGVDKDATQNNNKPTKKYKGTIVGLPMGVTRREFEFEELEDLL